MTWTELVELREEIFQDAIKTYWHCKRAEISDATAHNFAATFRHVYEMVQREIKELDDERCWETNLSTIKRILEEFKAGKLNEEQFKQFVYDALDIIDEMQSLEVSP